MTEGMDVKQLIQKVFVRNPAQAQLPSQGNPLDPFVQPMKPSKSQAFDPAILAEAQKTFTPGQGHAQGSPQGGQPTGTGTSTPTKGTVGNMIPPGWSSQSAK